MTSIAREPIESGPKSRLGLWFLAGFLLVFVGLMFVPMYFYDGHALYRMPAWYYYLLEIRRAWNSTGHLGPTSGSTANAISDAVIHVLLSAAGGALAMGVGWLVRKLSRKSH